jgi:hypothetical protein
MVRVVASELNGYYGYYGDTCIITVNASEPRLAAQNYQNYQNYGDQN